MVTNPADRIAEFLAARAKHITFHAEAVPSLDGQRSLVEAIRAGGATAGIAINPDTPISAIEEIADSIDLILVMSVHPGFGGQLFLPSVLDKVKELRTKHPKRMIQIDGGIDVSTASLARSAGANNIVAGHAIFSAPNRSAVIQALRG